MQRAQESLDVAQGVAKGLPRQPLAQGQINAHRLIGRAVVGAVEAATAIDQVGASAAAQAVVVAITQQAVVVIAALDDLDAAEAIPRRIAARCRAVGQIHHHAFHRQAVIHRVQPVAAANRVGAASAAEAVIASAAEELVVAAPALDAVGAAVTTKHVREVAADEMLDRHQQIVFGVAAPGRAIRQRHADAACRRQEPGRRVLALAAIEEISAAAAFERVITRAAYVDVVTTAPPQQVAAGATFQPVGEAVAAELIGIVGADQRFDVEIDIPLGKATLADARLQVGAHTGVRAAEHQRVKALATINPVAVVAAIDAVITRARIDGVGSEP